MSNTYLPGVLQFSFIIYYSLRMLKHAATCDDVPGKSMYMPDAMSAIVFFVSDDAY